MSRAPAIRIVLWCVDHPGWAAALLAAITLALALEIPTLRLVTSAEDFMVERDPARAYYEQFKQRFGSDTITTVVVKADDVFAASSLRAIQRISDALAEMDAVTRVHSLTTVRNIKGTGEALTTEVLVARPVPTAPAELERIRSDALGNRVFVGDIVSADGKAAAINAYTEHASGDGEFSKRFTAQVDALLRREAGAGITAYQIGAPFADATVGAFVLEDLRTVTPISLAVVFVLLLLAFRGLQGVVIPLATGALSIVWGLGLMGLFGLPLSILTVVIPSLVLVIGSAEDVHMLVDYHHQLETGLDRLAAIRAMVQRTAFPLFVTSATTIVGFGSLATSDITMLIQFGYASALALTANLVITMIAVPLILRFWPVPRRLHLTPFEEAGSGGRLPGWLQRLGEFNLRHRVLIAAVALVVALGSLVGWRHLRVDTDFVGFLPESSTLRQRIRDFEASMGGAFTFSVVIETGREGGLKDPQVLQAIARLQDFLRATGQVDKTIAVTDYLRQVHREMHGGDPAFERLPDTSDEVAQYLLILEGSELSKYVDFSASAASIVVQRHGAGTQALSALLERIDRYVAQHVPPALKVRHTGEEVLIRNAADYMAINEITSFGTTFLIIALVHAWLFRSIRAGLLSLIPDVIPVLLGFGLMGLLGIPLNPGTAMIASIALGIAVDDTVHHMITFSRQLQAHGDRRRATLATMRSQGRPVIYVSLALAGGFFVLAVSHFVPTVQFGLLAGAVMLIAMAAELVLTPITVYSMPIGRWFRLEGGAAVESAEAR